ncbi:MAG: LON peptidase substrate-binding domain-containing protein, partial [Planctomycetes bacterium]|nr:LON peptidase substrate-binding domain-containing protein [Planctomycetota bacterium]
MDEREEAEPASERDEAHADLNAGPSADAHSAQVPADSDTPTPVLPPGPGDTSADSAGSATPPPPSNAPPAHSSKGPAVPEQLPLLPLRTDVVFPQMVLPLVVGRERGIRLVDDVMETTNKLVALVTQKSGEIDDPGHEDLHPALCVANILKMLKFPDGTTRIVVHGIARARVAKVVEGGPYLIGTITTFADEVEPGVETDALLHTLVGLFNQVVEYTQIPEELQVAVMNTREAGHVADLLACGLPFTVEEKQELLDEGNVQKRIQKLILLLKRQLEVLELSSKIDTRVGKAINKLQREHFLREQLKAIR